MAISVFPAGGGEFITNDFVVDMNDSNNNVANLGRSYAQGSYDVAIASGDTSFDIYALDEDSALVGYTNNATLVTSAPFTSLVILGVSTTEKITFGFAGASNNTNQEGGEVTAGAYLESINPTDLPTVDDTATITGGNFASDVEIFFESGAESLPAKNITRSDSSSLIVTRPDNFDPALDPWDVRVNNPGVPAPVGSNAHILSDAVDAGAVPVFQTTSPLPAADLNESYSFQIQASDADGDINFSVSAGTLPTGLSLNSATGVIDGTPTSTDETFTIKILDDGGNENTREFLLPVNVASGGAVSKQGNYTQHEFNSSDDFILFGDLDVEYQVIAGGAGAAGGFGSSATGSAGGGAGGFRSSASVDNASGGGASLEQPLSLTGGTYAITVGAGGNDGDDFNAVANNGGDSTFANITSVGGGIGANLNRNASNGGSGGGDTLVFESKGAGSGIAGQGFDGGDPSTNDTNGGGGGAGGAGVQPPSAAPPLGGGPGITTNITGNAETVAEGGHGAGQNNDNQLQLTTIGSGGTAGSRNANGFNGVQGRVIVRYEKP